GQLSQAYVFELYVFLLRSFQAPVWRSFDTKATRSEKMIEFAKNAESTRYVIFVNKNCNDLSGAVQRTRAKNCLLAPLTRLNGFLQHELYRHPASMLAHFCVLVRSW